VSKPEIDWRITCGPWFDNMLCVLQFGRRKAHVRFDRSAPGGAGAAVPGAAAPGLEPVCEAELS
jgi:hypothetical protein